MTFVRKLNILFYFFYVYFFTDPYLNIDAGTMSPIEHGEVYVLDDGGEVMQHLVTNFSVSFIRKII